MAHNINYNNKTGKHSFFSVKENAWHNLGQIIEHYPTSGEAIVYAGLDFEVEKRPLFTCSSENFAVFNDVETDEYMNSFEPNILVEDFFSTVRTDTAEVLGVVGKDYNVVQNTDAFEFEIVDMEGVRIDQVAMSRKAEKQYDYSSYFKPVLKLYSFGLADHNFLFRFRNHVYLQPAIEIIVYIFNCFTADQVLPVCPVEHSGVKQVFQFIQAFLFQNMCDMI